MKYIRL